MKYGGDFGDVPNDRNFCCNGIFDAWRKPHGSALEARALFCGDVESHAEAQSRRDEILPAQHPSNLSTSLSAVALAKADQPFNLNFWRAPTDNDRGWKIYKE